MKSRLQICCESVMEASWLAAAVIVPFYFNISSARVFEPDKMFVVKLLAVLSAAAWAAKKISAQKAGRDRAGAKAPSRSLLAHPLAVTVLSLAAIYTLSSVLSVMPVLSWWGSYQRAQGTIAFYSYAVLFLVVLSELRTQAQLKRLNFAFILGSLPIIIYVILQYYKSDPLPWVNPFRDRSSGSMGNPIFLGAYLVMVIPLTFARLAEAVRMKRPEDQRKPGLRFAGYCGAILILQLVALLCTLSRGPLIGLAAASYFCLFILLVSKRGPGKKPLSAWVAFALVGFAPPVLMVAVIRMTPGLRAGIGLTVMSAILVSVAAVYYWLWRTRWGRHLLWFTWLAQTLTLAGLLIVGPARLLGEGAKAMPLFGRLAQLSDATVSVRLLLWQTGLNAVQAKAPADLAAGKRDSLHFLRDAIGYGPECIGVAANRHAVPGLVRYHAGETIDRMHNDVFDSLLSVGFAGAVASLIMVAASFFCSFRYFGFVSDGRRRNIFLGFAVVGSAAGILVPWALGSAHLSGIGVQAGLLAGLFAFVAWCGFGNPGSGLDGQKTLVLCILAALIAHFVETGVGIAVTSTRLYFFLLLAVLTVVAAGKVEQKESPKNQSSDRRWFRNPLLPFASIAFLVVFAMSWCFLSNANEERSPLLLFLRTWFARPPEARFFLPGTILLFMLTVLGSLALMAGELWKPSPQKARFWKTAGPWAGVMVLLWLASAFLSAVFSTALDPMEALPVNVALHAETHTSLFVAGLLLLLGSAALSLIAADATGYAAADPVRIRAVWPCLLLAICAYAAIGELTVRPARADIARRVAGICETSAGAPAAIPVYERAATLAPRVGSYQMSLGFARRHAGMSESDPSRREALLAAAEQAYRRALVLNPLDPAGYRAMGSLYTQRGESMSDKTARDAMLRRALPLFHQAAQLSPNYWNTYTEFGRCYFLLGEHKRARELYEKSLAMNPRSARTYMFLGEMQYWQKDLDQALRSFQRASRLDRQNLEARKNTGFLLSLLGRKDEAIRVYLEALVQAPKDLTLLRRLASLYLSLADFRTGMTYALRAYEATPASGRRSFDAFVQELQAESR